VREDLKAIPILVKSIDGCDSILDIIYGCDITDARPDAVDTLAKAFVAPIPTKGQRCIAL
jgi:hypothetical protein